MRERRPEGVSVRRALLYRLPGEDKAGEPGGGGEDDGEDEGDDDEDEDDDTSREVRSNWFD